MEDMDAYERNNIYIAELGCTMGQARGALKKSWRQLKYNPSISDNRVEQGKEAALIASLNALAVAKEHLGDLDRLKKLVKLTVLVVTTEQFTEHATVADGASNLFAQIFGPKTGHVRLVYGTHSFPLVHLWLLTQYSKKPMSDSSAK